MTRQANRNNRLKSTEASERQANRFEIITKITNKNEKDDQ